MTRPALLVAMCVALASVGAACSGSSEATVAPPSESTGSVAWSPCGSMQCGTLSVPLDGRRPAGRQITLALARRPASGHRIGVLFVNPGGPGGSGVEFLRDAADTFPSAIRNSFDIIAWDQRGVGGSAPVECLDDLDEFYAVDRAPVSAAGIARNVAVTRQFVDACKRRSGDLLPYVSTDATVHDLDAIRAAIGESRINYLGFSYGTYLGALYAKEFPSRVRTMVLDGAVDPSLSYTDSVVQQSEGFERALDDFFAHCRQDRCKFTRGADPAVAFDALSSAIATAPLPATVSNEPRTLGPGELDIGVASALYAGRAGWSQLANALDQAVHGDGSGVLTLADAYTDRSPGGKYSNETAALYAISCLDAPSPTTVAGVEAVAARAARVSPHFGAATAWLGLPCTLWPVPPEAPVAPVTAPAAPPLLVLGATGDPVTPYSWAQSLARQLGTGHLLTASGDAHTSYGRGDGCVDKTVDTYLLTTQLPAPGTRCN